MIAITIHEQGREDHTGNAPGAPQPAARDVAADDPERNLAGLAGDFDLIALFDRDRSR